jgi:hypothetical protein
MALAETHPAIVAALDVIGPNRAGDPIVGAFGFLPAEDRLALAKAADLAHRRARTEGWGWSTPEELADYMAVGGSWRRLVAEGWHDHAVSRASAAWLNHTTCPPELAQMIEAS